MSSLRKKIEIAQTEGATHFYSNDVNLFMCKRINKEWWYRPIQVFGTQRDFSWFKNLADADESHIDAIEIGLRRLDERDKERRAKQTGQYSMF
jgi:hypothetical protein